MKISAQLDLWLDPRDGLLMLKSPTMRKGVARVF